MSDHKTGKLYSKFVDDQERWEEIERTSISESDFASQYLGEFASSVPEPSAEQVTSKKMSLALASLHEKEVMRFVQQQTGRLYTAEDIKDAQRQGNFVFHGNGMLVGVDWSKEGDFMGVTMKQFTDGTMHVVGIHQVKREKRIVGSRAEFIIKDDIIGNESTITDLTGGMFDGLG